MATVSCILAWEILWKEESGGLWPRDHNKRVQHNLVTEQQQEKLKRTRLGEVSEGRWRVMGW